MGRPSAAILPLVAENEYDGDGVGDGNLTKVTLHPGVGADRVTRMWYDWRGRLVSTADAANVTYLDLDNLGRATKTRVYEPTAAPGSTNGVPHPPGDGTLLRAQSETLYDARGRAYRLRQRDVRQSDGRVGGALESALWLDGRGSVIKSLQPGGLVSKTVYDGANRPTAEYVTDGGGDSSWTDADDVNGDIVVGQVETTYDRNGNAIFLTSKERFHNASGTGALTGGNARVSFVANYHDTADRLAQSVDFGTNGGTAPTLQSDGRPALPARVSADGWDPFLRTDYEYNPGGLLDLTWDPRGVGTKSYHDAAGRLVAKIEAYTDGTPTATTNRTTIYGYNGLDQQVLVKLDLPGSINPTTQYIYGVLGPADGGESSISSQDLLGEIRFPDPATGLASSSDHQTFAYNALGQVTRKRARDGVTHALTYNDAGRLASDHTAPHADVDPFIGTLSYEYDALGRGISYASFGADAGLKSQVTRSYNGLGQIVREEQSGWMEVSPGNWQFFSGTVEYHYSSETGGLASNHSRMTSMVYPSGRVLNYEYGPAGALNDRISRVGAISDAAGAGAGRALEQYSYLGLSEVVERRRPTGTPGTDLVLSYVYQAGDNLIPLRPDAGVDGGDDYTGLDRFGRILDQNWLTTGTGGASVDRWQYAYDGGSNVLYQDNINRPEVSSLEHGNGVPAATAYDALDRQLRFQRGALSAGGGGRLDTVADPDVVTPYLRDAAGNLETSGYSYDAQNRMTGTGYEYYADGTSKTIRGADDWVPTTGAYSRHYGGATATYDGWDRLSGVKVKDTSVNDEDALSMRYFYDALGRRVGEQEVFTVEYAWGLVEFQYLNHAAVFYSITGQPLEEQSWYLTDPITGAGVWQTTTQYVWSAADAGRMVLRDKDAAAGGSWGGANNGLDERLYAIDDGQGNITAIADANGQVVERYVYDPLGNVEVLDASWTAVPKVTWSDWPSLGPDALIRRIFTRTNYAWDYFAGGMHWDSMSRLYERGGSYYDPVHDRLMQPDPGTYAEARNAYRPPDLPWLAKYAPIAVGVGITVMTGGLGAGLAGAMIVGSLAGFGAGFAGGLINARAEGADWEGALLQGSLEGGAGALLGGLSGGLGNQIIGGMGRGVMRSLGGRLMARGVEGFATGGVEGGIRGYMESGTLAGTFQGALAGGALGAAFGAGLYGGSLVAAAAMRSAGPAMRTLGRAIAAEWHMPPQGRNNPFLFGDLRNGVLTMGRRGPKNGGAGASRAPLYEVRLAKDLRTNPWHGVATDTVAEHAPQTKWARDLIPGHSEINDFGWEPAIRVTRAEADAITLAEILTQVPAGARDALAMKIRILRNLTDAPNRLEQL
jgi:YD repeat-containing protein